MGEASWLPAHVDLLKRLWANGLSGTQISHALGGRFSGKAVIGKANRLHLEPRDSTVNRSWSHRTKPYIPKSPQSSSKPLIGLDVPDPSPIGPIGDFPAGQTCRFIAGEVKNFQCCGLPGFPWCDFHAAKFLVKPQPRKT